MSSGNKYHREIFGLKAHGGGSVIVDVYAVLSAYVVTNPGAQHALKKVLCSGIRGKSSRLQDLTEARDALDRVIEDAEREASQEKANGAAEEPRPPRVRSKVAGVVGLPEKAKAGKVRNRSRAHKYLPLSG